MLIKIGNALVNTEDVTFAWIDNSGGIEVQFRDKSRLRVETKDADADLSKLEKATTAR